MRDIAEIQERISEAFASSASVDVVETTVEQRVPPIGLGSEAKPASRSSIGGLLARIVQWRRTTPSARLQRDLKNAEAESAAKSRQIATVVHELRTPLNGILGMTHLFGQTRLTAEQQNYLSGIRQSGYALAQLVEDLLDYSTLEAGRFRLNTRAADLRQLIEGVVEMLAPRAHGKRIEIAATVSAEVPELLDIDPARLRQVLFNVVGNAVKFTTIGGVLVRVLLEESGMIAISVADTGPGMTPEEQAQIFGEYEQVGSAEARSEGTGLGLGIASRILSEFGGSLSVTSRKGTGSTFIIRFPLRLAEDAAAGDHDRSRALLRSRVLLLAPEGPAAIATVASIETLGGVCRHVSSPQNVQMLIDRAAAIGSPYTDLIVDHRLASEYACEPSHSALHRILLVNPEERASQPQDFFDAWLIRPLREKSLIDVLSGRLRGFGTRDAFADRAAPSAPPPKQEEKVEQEPGLDILLGEDDPVNAMLVSAILRKAGHRVRLMQDFPSLTGALGEAAADLVICDMHMPGGTIVDFLTHRATVDVRDIPVVVLTGDSRGEARRKVIEHGACKVLQKPVDPGVLIEEVRLLGRTAVELKQAR
jgi:signal transduction histidine kinase/CheY-like chemotaxis protein